MNNIIKKPYVKKIIFYFGFFLLSLIVINYFIMPWFVKSTEVTVPKVLGYTEQEAISKLKEAKLIPVIGDTAFDIKFARGTILLQKPGANSVVKEGRKIYLVISSGDPSIYVPLLRGKSLRDAKFALERSGLRIGDTVEVESSSPKGVIIDQQYSVGTNLKRGQYVTVTISKGPAEGNIEVPDLVGKSLTEAENILITLKLKIGKINYQPSFSLLPNTVKDQFPTPGSKLNEGDKVDLFVTKIVETKEEINIKEN